MEKKGSQKDIFDRIMSLPLLWIFEPFYKKHKEMLLYLFFGGLAFVVSITAYWVLNVGLGINELIANVISWLVTVEFAFLTNRIWVFSAPTETAVGFIKQMMSFFGGRLVTLLIEEVILGVFITWLGFNSMLVKTTAQIIVIMLNYLISKLFIFSRKKG